MNRNWKTISTVWLAKWKDEKQRNRLIIALGLLGLVLIMLSELPGKTSQAAFDSISSQTEENEEYVRGMEEKLNRLVENVSGAGKCHVMITLEQGTQYVYASENKKVVDETQSHEGESSSKIQQKDNSESKIVVIEENGVSRPLVETSREPQIKGVVVVCDGGNSSVVQQRITEVLTTVLGIRSNQVCVVPRK